MGQSRTIVHLVRHGEVHNPAGLLYGRLPDYHLSERGIQMAERVAEHFRERDVVTLRSSPLERAQETAAPLAQALGLPVVIDPRVIEAANHFEGLRLSFDGALRHPKNWL
jgi:broad specificity phosphatase PhoE